MAEPRVESSSPPECESRPQESRRSRSRWEPTPRLELRLTAPAEEGELQSGIDRADSQRAADRWRSQWCKFESRMDDGKGGLCKRFAGKVWHHIGSSAGGSACAVSRLTRGPCTSVAWAVGVWAITVSSGA